MQLRDVERDITKNVVERFLYENKPSPRKLLAQRFRFSQFHRLTDSAILTNTTLGTPTGKEMYLPRPLAFHYCGDQAVQGRARQSISAVFRILQRLFDAEPDKEQFTPEDLEAQAKKIFDLPIEKEMLKLGLYLARDMGVLSSFSMKTDQTEVTSFGIAERIVEINDFDRVWDDFTAQSTAGHEELLPQQAAPEIDLSEGGIPLDSEGLDQMARTQRDTVPVPHQPTISQELALHRLQKLLDQIPEIRSKGHDSPAISTWAGNIKIVLAELYGESSIIFREFRAISYSPAMFYQGQPESEFVKWFNAGLEEAKGFLESRVNDLSERVESAKPRTAARSDAHPLSRRIFVVHGHDHGSKETVARFLGQLDLEPIILHEKPDQGKTVIEKFETHAANTQCAVVILTADDVAHSKADPESKESRARQNVILELGYFVGKLGRHHTFALVEKGVALPSDIHGLVYIPLDEGGWRLRLVKELKAAGLTVDANRAFT